MQEDDVQALRIAVKTLEHPRLAARLAEIAGKPIELFNRALPDILARINANGHDNDDVFLRYGDVLLVP